MVKISRWLPPIACGRARVAAHQLGPAGPASHRPVRGRHHSHRTRRQGPQQESEQDPRGPGTEIRFCCYRHGRYLHFVSMSRSVFVDERSGEVYKEGDVYRHPVLGATLRSDHIFFFLEFPTFLFFLEPFPK